MGAGTDTCWGDRATLAAPGDEGTAAPDKKPLYLGVG
jgi:hypothetical protein